MDDISSDTIISEGPKDMLGAQTNLKPATWSDIALYILGGFGIYSAASFLVGLAFQEITLGLTFTVTVVNFLCLAGSVFLFGVLRKKVSWASMGLIPLKNILKWAILGAIIAVAIIPLRGAVGLIIETLINGDLSSLAYREDLLTVGLDTWYGVLLMLLGVGVLAPIAEELFFRGLIYDWLRQKVGVELGIAISSLLFGLAHYDSLAVVGSSFVMGIAMALAYEKTRSLWIAIFMHISTNAGVVLLLAVLSRFGDILADLQY